MWVEILPIYVPKKEKKKKKVHIGAQSITPRVLHLKRISLFYHFDTSLTKLFLYFFCFCNGMNFTIFTNTSPMALSSTLRFSSSFLRHNHSRHALFLSPPRRFLSFPPSRTPILASKDKERDGNGSVATVGPKDSGRIVPVELHEEMTGSYITYSMSVLLGRALPDVRDGLKPVHRRIL